MYAMIDKMCEISFLDFNILPSRQLITPPEQSLMFQRGNLTFYLIILWLSYSNNVS